MILTCQKWTTSTNKIAVGAAICSRAALIFLLLVVGYPASAQYKSGRGIFSGGYEEKQISKGRWKVSSKFNGERPDLSTDVSIYRAAVLAKRAGFSYVKIVNGRITVLQNIYSSKIFGQYAEFYVVGTNEPEKDIPCEAKNNRARSYCRILNVEAVGTQLARKLSRDFGIDVVSDPQAEPPK